MSGFWHGGAPGLSAGMVLLPRVRLELRARYAAAEVPYDPERVYVTTDRQLARAFAASFDQGVAGALYSVRPVGDLVPDPDYPFDPPVSFMVGSAVVVRVAEARVRMTEAQEVKATARWTTWPDGSAMYDEAGFLTLCEEWAEAGVTTSRLRALGPWRHLMAATAELNAEIVGQVQSG